MWENHGYIIHTNLWNASGYNISQKLSACSYKNWSVRTTADNNSHDGAVKSYPNVHKDFHNWSTGSEPRLGTFRGIQSKFKAKSPNVGIYNTAYDIWVNGVGNGGGRNREVMIWTHNHQQVPSGSVIARGVKLSGHKWKVYATSDNRYLAFVPNHHLDKGTMRIKSMLKWLRAHGRIPARSTLGQICFGFEVVSTGGRPATFTVKKFSVHAKRR